MDLLQSLGTGFQVALSLQNLAYCFVGVALGKLLLDSAAAGSLSDVDGLLTAGVDLATKDSNGRTPLHIAAANGHTSILEQRSGSTISDSRMSGISA